MSDPTNPYGAGGDTPYGNQPAYGAQPTYGTQASYGTQPAYSQAPAGQQPAYGGPAAYNAGAAYGQPMYGQVVYALNPAIERVRSNASMVRIMSLVSFVTLGPLVSFGAWFWSMSLISEAESLGAPEDVLRDVRGARTTALICGIIGIVLLALIVALPFFLFWLSESSK
jgi:antigen family protein